MKSDAPCNPDEEPFREYIGKIDALGCQWCDAVMIGSRFSIIYKRMFR